MLGDACPSQGQVAHELVQHLRANLPLR
jgi:hypothetical protein